MQKLISLITAFLLFIFYPIFFTACQKEYSYEGGNSIGTGSGTAVYTLNGAGGACTGSVLMGDYYAGIPLAPGNTVQLLVNVTTIGTYALTTNSVNGIQFSTSGNFTTTGTQTITLTGSGTPVSAGSFPFTPPVGLGCAFIITVTTAAPAVAGFTLDCTNAVINGNYTSGIALTNTNTTVISVNVTKIGDYSINTDTLNGIHFSASGTFASTGNQNVTLIGSGTPEFARYLTFTASSGISSCSFNVSVMDPEPLATYVLESGFGSPNPCIYTVSGTYNSNTPLSNAHTVTIHVFVTYIGNFTVSTSIINGMMFSYSGTFTTTGSQLVVLTGSGTPLAQGTNIFFPQIVGPHPLGGESCSFYIEVQ
jgi:hypothetical protein